MKNKILIGLSVLAVSLGSVVVFQNFDYNDPLPFDYNDDRISREKKLSGVLTEIVNNDAGDFERWYSGRKKIDDTTIDFSDVQSAWFEIGNLSSLFNLEIPIVTEDECAFPAAKKVVNADEKIDELLNNSNCKVIFFEQGEYFFSRTVNIKRRVKLVGKGHSTQLLFSGKDETFINIDSDNVILESFWIMGESDFKENEFVSSLKIGINTGSSDNLQFKKLKISKFKTGINSIASKTNFASNINIIDNTFNTLGKSAVTMHYSENVLILGNDIRNIWGGLDETVIKVDPITKEKIITVKENSKFADGFYFLGAKKVLIQDNIIKKIRRNAIVLEGNEDYHLSDGGTSTIDVSSVLCEDIAIIGNKIYDIFGSRGTEFNAGVWAEFGKYRPYSILVAHNVIENPDRSLHDKHPSSYIRFGIIGSGLFIKKNTIVGQDLSIRGTSNFISGNAIKDNTGVDFFTPAKEEIQSGGAIKIEGQRSASDYFETMKKYLSSKIKKDLSCDAAKVECERIQCKTDTNCTKITEDFSALGAASIIYDNDFYRNKRNTILVADSNGKEDVWVDIIKNDFKNNLPDAFSPEEPQYKIAEIFIYRASSDGLKYNISSNLFEMNHNRPAISAVANYKKDYGCRGQFEGNKFMYKISPLTKPLLFYTYGVKYSVINEVKVAETTIDQRSSLTLCK